MPKIVIELTEEDLDRVKEGIYSHFFYEELIENGKILKDDDLISRKKAIELTWDEPESRDYLNVLTEIRDRIKALPPALPKENKKESRLGDLQDYDIKSIELANNTLSLDVPLTEEEAIILSPLKETDPTFCPDAKYTYLSITCIMGVPYTMGIRATIRGEFEGGEQELELTLEEVEKLRIYINRAPKFYECDTMLELLNHEIHQGQLEANTKNKPGLQELVLKDLFTHGALDHDTYVEARGRVRANELIKAFAESEYLNSENLVEDAKQFKETGIHKYLAFEGLDEKDLLTAADNLAEKEQGN